MKALLIFLLAGFTSSQSFSQIAVSANSNAFLNTAGWLFPVVGATPVSNSKQIDLREGSPFFRDEWLNSSMVTQDGKTYHNVQVKLNLLNNQVHFTDSAGRELIVSSPLREVRLLDSSIGNAHFVNGALLPTPKQGWFLLLVNDTITLLKGFKKNFEEHRSYNSAIEYSIKTYENYFVFLGAKNMK